MLEQARPACDGFDDPVADQHCADRRIAAAKPLRDGHQIGQDSFLLAGMQSAGTAHAAHHLVENEQDAVPVADLAHALEISGYRSHSAKRRAHDCFGNEGKNGFRAEFLDLGLKLLRQAFAVSLRCFISVAIAIFVTGRYVKGLDQKRSELLAPPFIAADGQRAKRVAVIALLSRDKMLPFRLTLLDEILPRKLERRLDRFRTAADKIDLTDTLWCVSDQIVRQLFGDARREETGMRIGELVDLLMHRGQHVRM